MSDTIVPDSGSPSEDDDLAGRRNFLSRSSLMLAMMALAGGAGAADAAMLTTSDVPSFNAVLKDAISNGKINTKSPEFMKLSPDLRSSLGTLTPSDLATLRSAQQILGSRITGSADNNGTIGM